jgi:hypothetical protein
MKLVIGQTIMYSFRSLCFTFVFNFLFNAPPISSFPDSPLLHLSQAAPVFFADDEARLHENSRVYLCPLFHIVVVIVISQVAASTSLYV